MTELALLRLASVPQALVDEIGVHARGCPFCRWSEHRPLVRHIDTRRCKHAAEMIERCIKFELEKKRSTTTQHRENDDGTEDLQR